MADAGMSDLAVREATGRNWAEWRAFLDGEGAAEMPHAEIAKHLGRLGIAPWWRQMVTVGYERMIGRRELGQSCTGDFAAGCTRTIAGNKDALLARWLELIAARVEFGGAMLLAEARVTQSDKWRYWRISLDDGTKALVSFCDKPGGKATVGVQHDGLSSAERIADVKAFWKGLIAQV